MEKNKQIIKCNVYDCKFCDVDNIQIGNLPIDIRGFSLNKYYSATGTKGYRWLESEMVKILDKEACIDDGYYNELVDDAVMTISQYGDFEMFVAEDY